MVAGLARFCFNSKILKTWSSRVQFVRWESGAHIVMTDDNSIVVCWHPEKFFPYEKSRPVTLIDKSTKLSQSHSILKVQSSKELLSVLKPKKDEIVRKELMAITHTVKHIWFPPRKQFRKKKPIDMDRPYL